ncbi:MAG: hypothetical protein JWQ04_3100 [Pedosphaera sp.]|nr:hypothetical protein [Pedosphaera sp.]
MPKKNTPRPAAPGGLNLAGFTPQQNQALLDLLVLAMYMDGNLAQVEEARVQQLLAAMGFASDYDRNREFDASVTRVRRKSQTAAAVKTLTAALTGNSPSRKTSKASMTF